MTLEITLATRDNGSGPNAFIIARIIARVHLCLRRLDGRPPVQIFLKAPSATVVPSDEGRRVANEIHIIFKFTP